MSDVAEILTIICKSSCIALPHNLNLLDSHPSGVIMIDDDALPCVVSPTVIDAISKVEFLFSATQILFRIFLVKKKTHNETHNYYYRALNNRNLQDWRIKWMRKKHTGVLHNSQSVALYWSVWVFYYFIFSLGINSAIRKTHIQIPVNSFKELFNSNGGIWKLDWIWAGSRIIKINSYAIRMCLKNVCFEK